MFRTFMTDAAIAKKVVDYMQTVQGLFDRAGKFTDVTFEIKQSDSGLMHHIEAKFDDLNPDEFKFVSRVWAAGLGYYSGYMAAKAEALAPAGSF